MKIKMKMKTEKRDEAIAVLVFSFLFSFRFLLKCYSVVLELSFFLEEGMTIGEVCGFRKLKDSVYESKIKVFVKIICMCLFCNAQRIPRFAES